MSYEQRIAEALESIARSLTVLADEAAERRQIREAARATLLAQRAQLIEAEKSILRQFDLIPDSLPSDEFSRRLNALEKRGNDISARLTAFDAAHPEIAALELPV